jgi:hypothetical protein
VNGDGYADVILGCYNCHAPESPHTYEGLALVFLGSASGIADGNPSTAAGLLESNQQGASLGWSVAGAGDVNGDGYADVIAGAPYYDTTQGSHGAAFLFLGNGGGRPVLAQQLRGDTSSQPVQPWGRSYDRDAFKVSLRGTHPEGRGRVKLEVEHCQAGLAFGDPGCGVHVGESWTDVTPSSEGVTLIETIGGLASGALYRWRARVLHAPYSVSESGVTAPAHPAHGPWRRLSAQAGEADLRVLGPACDDDLDNDGDGFIDHPADPGCREASSNIENAACQDGSDNDGDGLIDFDGGLSIFGAGDPRITAPDPDCTISYRNSETPGRRSCGLGSELVLLLPLLLWRLRRRRIARCRGQNAL